MNSTMAQNDWEKPTENWIDHFMDPTKFMELLQDENTDRNLIGQLFDQFVSQALSSFSEAKVAKKKRLELNDIEFAEQKADKFWLFGWACAARLGWDLDILLKCSNVVRVFSMVSRLFEYTFNVKGESDILAYFARNPDTIFNNRNAFVSWLYARLVLMIDMQARTPAPPQKPTVSNPNNQVDPALVEAEKINVFVLNVRKHARNAAMHIDRLISLKFKQIEIPTFYYFQQSDNFNGNSSTYQDHINVNALSFVVRMKCDLLLAHFAASHFSTARKLFDEALPNFSALKDVHKVLHPLFAFDPKKFNGYKEALRDLEKPANKRSKLEINAYDFNTQRNSMSGSTFKTNAELDKSTTMYKIARVNEVPSNLHIPPNIDETLVYLNSGPPLWRILGCFDYELLLRQYNAFCKWDPSEHTFLDKITKDNISPILADILDKFPIQIEPVLFYIAQMEKLAENWDLKSWSKYIGDFFQLMIKTDHPWNKYVHAMPYEVLRINQKVHNSAYGHEKNLKVSRALIDTTKSLVSESVKTLNNLTLWAFGLFEKTYFVSLLNLGEFNSILLFNKNIEKFSSQYLNFARIIATLIEYEKDVEVQWKYFTPLLHKGYSATGITLSKDNFIEFIEMLKNVRVCDYILSFFVALYNKVANSGERQMLPYTEGMKTKDQNIYLINKEIFNPSPVDVKAALYSKPEAVDFEFISKIIGILLRNIVLFMPNNPTYSCQLADFMYAHGRYEEAAHVYTTIMNNFEQGFFEMSDYDKIVTDSMISKIVHCFYELEMFTLAAITGQLQRDIRIHLFYILPIIKQTPLTTDSGKSYFPYIYSIPVFEAISEAYDRNDLNSYYISLIKLCPTRALTHGNSADVIREESARRRSQFIEIVYKTMSNKPKKLAVFSEKIQLSIT